MNASARASTLLEQVRAKIDDQPCVIRGTYAKTYLGEDCESHHPTATEWSVWGAIQLLTGGAWEPVDAWSGHVYIWSPAHSAVMIEGRYYDSYAVPSCTDLRATLIAATDALESVMARQMTVDEYEESLTDGVDVICWLDRAIANPRHSE